MVKAKDLVGKTYTDAYSSLGLDSYLDSKTGHHLIRDVPEAETVLGIYEALSDNKTINANTNHTPSFWQRHRRLAAGFGLGTLLASVVSSGIVKEIVHDLPHIVM